MKQLLENWNNYLKINGWGYQILSETSFSRIITDYGERGYIIITSDRSCEAELGLAPGKMCSVEQTIRQKKINRENMKKFLADIRMTGYGYIPTFGGYKEDLIDPATGEPVKDEEGAIVKVDTESPENSVVIVARPDRGRDHESLKRLGVSLAKKFNQDSFFYKPPNNVDDNAYYIKSDGGIDMTFSDFTVDDLRQQFYTQMKKGPKHRLTALPENKKLVFRMRTSPTSAFEAKRRYGEIFMNFGKSK